MKTLTISPELALPAAAVTERIAFLGRTGSGKTYAAQLLFELMYAIGAQAVALDPVGKWYSLRLAADGQGAGLPIPVLGGLYGDIPLEPYGGALVADLVVDTGTSIVLDVSQFESDADKARFARDFASRFFFRKKARPSAVHVFIEECQEFVPQNPQREETRMLHDFTRMVKIGRNFGIGISLISQRPQEVNKKVLNLTELMFCFQLTGPQERKTLQGWIADKGLDEDIAAELPRLEVGHPHVWSPAWLKVSRVLPIGTKSTLDASSTPVVGAAEAVRELAPIDLERLRKEMKETIDKAKAEDPALLRQELAEQRGAVRILEHELQQVRAAADKVRAVRVQTVPVLAFNASGVKRLEHALARLDVYADRMDKGWARVRAAAGELTTQLAVAVKRTEVPLGAIPPGTLVEAPHGFTPIPMGPSRSQARRLAIQREGDSKLSGPERKILTALAQHGPRTVSALALLTGYSARGGAFKNPLSALRTRGFVDGYDSLQITPAGSVALGPFERLPSGPALLGYWIGHVDGPMAKLLSVLSSHRAPISVERLAHEAGYAVTGGAFKNPLSRLRTLGLVTGRAEVALSALLR